MVETTRRALMTGAASLAALSAAGAAASPAKPLHHPGLLRCIAAWRRAKNVCDTWHKAVYDPAYRTFKALRDAVPHYTTKATFTDAFGNPGHLSTEDPGAPGSITYAKRRNGTFTDDEYGRAYAELSDGMDERNAKLAQLDADWLATGLNKHSDRLGDLRFEKYVAIEYYPVRTLADLILKIETIRSIEDEPVDGDLLIADLNRIAGRA